MFECTEVKSALREFQDPRLDSDYIRCIPSSSRSGSILLVGVVHDHPASVYRVHAILEEISPDILALELPPLAVPLFRLYSKDNFTPPKLGGEMSMAIRSAGSTQIVGIDSPNWTFLRQLAGRVTAGRIPKTLFRDLGRDLVSSASHAIACQLGAAIGSKTRLRLRLYSHIEYDCSLFDSPTLQAEHEASHLAKQQSLLRAIEVPHARQLIDELRDESMAILLTDLSKEGDVIAVVGVEHLEPLLDHLRR